MEDCNIGAIKKRGRFINPYIKNTRRKLSDMVLWQLGYYNDPFPPLMPPLNFRYPNPKNPIKDDEPKVTWINHCTFLVQIGDLNILTDPIWASRCSPSKRFGPKRLHWPGQTIDELPKIDLVLISHNHYDHLDKKAVMELNRLYPKIMWVVPTGVKKLLSRWGIHRVIELTWWEEIALHFENRKTDLFLTFVPTQHFSGRGVMDKNRSLWGGFVAYAHPIQKRFYFVGDTGYNPYDFKNIGEKFGAIDLSLIPIGTYVPHKFMDPVHIDPDKAVKIHQDVGSRLSVGMHWNTFRLSSEPRFQPPYDLFLAMRDADLDPLSFRAIDVGQTINW